MTSVGREGGAGKHEHCWQCAAEAAADRALDPDGPGWARVGDYAVVADLLIAEGIANGLDDVPDTWRLRRADGRMVWLFRWPEKAS